MNISEFIGQHTGALLSAIKSKQVLYALHQGEDDQEKLNQALTQLGKLCVHLGDYVIKEKIDLSATEHRVYTRSPTIAETEFFCWAPHMNVGYSPFMFFKDGSLTKGLFVKLAHHHFSLCTKTFNKLAQAHYQQCFKNETPISLKAAKAYIKERLGNNNPDNIPIIEKTGYITFYIDLMNNRILAKSSHRDQDGLAAFFELVKKLSTFVIEQGNETLQPLVDVALKDRLFTTPYTNNAMSTGIAHGAYNLSSMVDFYAKQDQQDSDDACQLTPTWSAGFHAKDDASQKVTFKNSIGLFLPEGELPSDERTTFTLINRFAEEKALNISSLRVSGEIETGMLLKKYREEQPESAHEYFAGEYIDVMFNTQSKDGNIGMQISDGLPYHKEAVNYFLRTHFTENSCSNMVIEKTMLQWYGSLLEVIHNSINLFITLYLESNPVGKQFGEDSGLERALKAS